MDLAPELEELAACQYIALIIESKGLVQCIRLVALFCVHTDIVLDGIISKLQYSLFSIKRAMNRVSA